MPVRIVGTEAGKITLHHAPAADPRVYAAGKLARFPAPFSGVLPDLFVARGDTHETHSLAPGVATGAGRCGRGRLPDRSGEQQGSERSVTRLRADSAAPDGEQSPAATRITLRPHDPGTGEAIEKREVVKGYEYSRGQFLTFTAEELKALDVESSKVVDLEKFVSGHDIDPVYFDSPYYVYPDGPIAVEALRVIGAAMAQAGGVGLGRLTRSRQG